MENLLVLPRGPRSSLGCLADAGETVTSQGAIRGAHWHRQLWRAPPLHGLEVTKYS